ncbi:MAG: tetratricopeptide repeat protein [bacterium]
MQISITSGKKLLLFVIFFVFVLPSTREISSSQSPSTDVSREAEKHYQRGSEEYFAENYIGAYKEYSEAIKCCNKYFWAYLSRGYTLTKINRLKEAEADFTKAIDIDPKSVDAYICRGLVRKEIKNYEGGIEDFTQAIKIKPSFPDSYNNRGILKTKLNDYEGAIQDFSMALEMDERFGEAYFNRAAAKFNLNEKASACEDWQTAYGLGVKESKEMIEQHCQ